MAEEERDEEMLIEQRVAAYQESLPPVKPDRTVDIGGAQYSVYLDNNAREMSRLEAAIKQIQRGGRK